MSWVQKVFLFTCLTLLICAEVFAQIPPPSPPPAGAPLDGFTMLLLAVGAGYGANRIKDRKR